MRDACAVGGGAGAGAGGGGGGGSARLGLGGWWWDSWETHGSDKKKKRCIFFF